MRTYWLERQLYKLKPYKAPSAATAKGWRVWREETRKAHPVAWFIFETCIDGAFDFWRYRVVKPLSDFRWWLAYRLCPVHRYHVVDTGLRPGYHDEREILLHASFAVLTRFVERQRTDGHVNWDSDPDHARVWAEMQAMDHWWRVERPARESKLPELPELDLPFLEQFEAENQEREDVKAWNKIAAQHNAMEKAFDEEDEAMLIRLAKIRLALWD